MKRSIVNYPPSWAPNAVPSDLGWRHPTTGELLVSVKGGVFPIDETNEVSDQKLIVDILPVVTILSEDSEQTKTLDETIKPVEVLTSEEPPAIPVIVEVAPVETINKVEKEEIPTKTKKKSK